MLEASMAKKMDRPGSVSSTRHSSGLASFTLGGRSIDDVMMESDDEGERLIAVKATCIFTGDDDTQRKWCVCNEKSYGNMVACDNASVRTLQQTKCSQCSQCPYEWFHYQCVNIREPPKGRWYCPYCTDRMRQQQASSSLP